MGRGGVSHGESVVVIRCGFGLRVFAGFQCNISMALHYFYCIHLSPNQMICKAGKHTSASNGPSPVAGWKACPTLFGHGPDCLVMGHQVEPAFQPALALRGTKIAHSIA